MKSTSSRCKLIFYFSINCNEKNLGVVQMCNKTDFIVLHDGQFSMEILSLLLIGYTSLKLNLNQ